jgi:hypothetical protein
MVAAKDGGRADIQTKYRTGYDRHVTLSFESTVFGGYRLVAKYPSTLQGIQITVQGSRARP